MLTFKQYLFGSKSLLDESFKDIIKQYPHDKDALTSYRDTLTSAGHDYSDHKLRWLYRQHLNGHLTPDHPDLHKTLETLRTHVSVHGVKDPWNKTTTFKDLHDLMKPHFGTASTKKERFNQGREQIFDDKESGFSAYHFKDRDSLEHWHGAYGRYPTGCDGSEKWCVTGQMYDHYGKTYTIHHKDPKTDKEHWWAYHPETKKITSQRNDGDHDVNEFLKTNPHFRNVINAIDNHPDYKLKEKLHNTPHLLTRDEITQLLGTTHDNKMRLAKITNLSKEHIDQLIKDESPNVREEIANHPKLEKTHIDKLVDDKNPDVRKKIAKHPKLEKTHIDKLVDDKNPDVRQEISEHPKLEKEHIDQLIKDESPEVRYTIAEHPKLEKEHIDQLVADESSDVREQIAKHPKLEKEHIDQLIKDESPYDRYTIAKHPKLEKEHIDQLIKDERPYVREQIAKHPNLHKKHIDRLINDEDENIRWGIAKHPNLEKEHIDQLVEDEDSDVREQIAKHPNLEKEHIDKLINDESESVRELIAKHPNLEKEHIDKLINDESPYVRQEIAKHPALHKEHIDKLLQSDLFRDLAIQHPAYKKYYPKVNKSNLSTTRK